MNRKGCPFARAGCKNCAEICEDCEIRCKNCCEHFCHLCGLCFPCVEGYGWCSNCDVCGNFTTVYICDKGCSDCTKVCPECGGAVLFKSRRP